MFTIIYIISDKYPLKIRVFLKIEKELSKILDKRNRICYTTRRTMKYDVYALKQ
jgi:hypothetical protein